MRTVSNTFTALHNAEADCEIRLDIAGTIYTKEEIFEGRLSSSAIPDDKPSVGKAIASQLQFGIEPKSTIPRMAEIKLELRLTDGTTASEWLHYGTYFIDTRETSVDGEYMEITAYDSMLKAEQTYKDLTAFTTWPQTDTAIVNEICTLMGVALDSRTSLAGYAIGYPNDYTMREMLGFIATANGGNWIITPENKLRLVPLNPTINWNVIKWVDSQQGNYTVTINNSVVIFDPTDGTLTDVGRDMTEFLDLGALQPFTGVMLYYGDESAFSAGNNSGRVLEADIPWATQAMATAILSKIIGYVYHGFEAEKVNITPAFELGDIVRANGIVAPIMSFDVVFDGAFYPDISAPSDLEVDNEYHYESKTERQFKRVVKLGENYYGTTIDRENGILIQLFDSQGQPTGAYAKLNASTLEFAKNDGTKAIYFDPTTGEYIFNGKLIIRDGMLQFEGESQFVKVRYSTDKTVPVPDSWSEEWNSAWDNDTTEVWAIYSYDNGSTWKSPVLIQGKRGPQGNPGTPGSDADVPAWVKAYTQGAQFDTLVTDEWVVAMNLYGSKVFAGDSNSQYLELDDDGLKLFVKQTIDGVEQFVEKIKLGASDGSTWSTPFLRLGLGSYSSGTAFIKKTESGLFLGVAGYHVTGDQIAMIESISDPTEYNFTGVYVTGAELLHYKNGVPYSTDSYLRFTD